jgi:hypothetical protein
MLRNHTARGEGAWHATIGDMVTKMRDIEIFIQKACAIL